ncbi:hypothetical protein QYE76_007871 [Lolium multiflorum]|uniref:CCHC-type domain-containing protein n=1 Tax=Lolium multiflorum TaxID=4521 RepID=A0AAD8QI27_LOLMU|nr:hypothetical protein QYE76_007871 [Lolium multiflorum]
MLAAMHCHGWAYCIRGPAGRHALPQRPCWPTRSHAAAGPAGRCLPPPRSLANHAPTCTHLPPDGRHPRMRRRSAGSRPRVPAAAPRAAAAAPLVAGARRPPPLRCYARRRRGPAGRHPRPCATVRAAAAPLAGSARLDPGPAGRGHRRPRRAGRPPSARRRLLERPRLAAIAHAPPMTGMMNREFAELAQNGLNYLTWASRSSSRAKRSKNGVLQPFGPSSKRGSLVKYTVQPQAEAEWMRMRFADFKTVGEYSSALHRICTSLLLCGNTITDKEKIEKTLSTFHPTAIQSSRNYRQEKFQQYAALIDALQVDEAQDEVIKKNFSLQPFVGGPSQEVNAGAYKVRKPIMKKRGKKGKKGPNPPNPANNQHAGKGEARPQDCFRCGSKTHFYRQCRAPKHVVDAYKAKKARETHLLSRWRHHRRPLRRP